MKKYEVDGKVRAVNAFTGTLARLGLGGRMVILRTTGRRSSQPREVTVSPIEVDGTRYLVCSYGAVGWVHNVRASGRAELRRGRSTESVMLTEVDGEAAVPVLQAYFAREKYVRPYYGVPDEPTAADFAAEAEAHPVFRISKIGDTGPA